MRNPLHLPGAGRRSQPAQAFISASLRDRSDLASLVSALLILGFVAWTVATRYGIAHGSRPTTWVTHSFGSWPAALTRVEGSASVQLSVFASFVGGDTVGMTAIGTSPDFGDGGAINGSRFVTGPSAGNVSSMSVHVRGPLDEPAHRNFQLALYSDSRGAPDALIAQSLVGTLTADTWNTVPIVTALEPNTAYWLMYNTNASRPELNNATFSQASEFSLDQLLNRVRTAQSQRVARAVRLIGHPVVSGLLIGMTAWWTYRRDRQTAVRLLVAAASGIALEAALKMTVFKPYSAYPSGHALRLSMLAVVVSRLARGRLVGSLAWAVAIGVAAASLIGKDHFFDEIVGGALAGAALATMAVPSAVKSLPERKPAGAPVWVPGKDRRAVPRPGPDRRRGTRAPPSRSVEPASLARSSR